MTYTKEQLSLVSTTTLPSEVSEVIRAAAIERLRYVPKMRQYGLLDSSPSAGDATYIWDNADEMSAAKEVAEGSAPDYEDAGATKGSASFMKIMKAFKITWEADNLKQINLRAVQTRQAVDHVFDYEDDKIVDQLVTDAGNTFTGTDWSANTADPVYDIRRAKRLNRDDGYKSDLLILSPTNNEELDSVIASNTWYSVTEQTLKTGEPFPFMGLKRVENTNQATGTATVIKSGPGGAFITAEAKALSINIFDENDEQTTKVQVYERVVPCATTRTTAVCSITSI